MSKAMEKYRKTEKYRVANARHTAKCRANWIATGICVVCGKNPATEGRKCSQCREANRLPARLFHLKYAGVSESERAKAASAWTIFNQICDACGVYQCCGVDWVFDHNHATKKFRGIIGRKCNTVLGFVSDDATRLARMAQYLERSL